MTATKYAILRAEKLKTFGNIGASLSHNYRTRPTPNADPERENLNSHSMPNPQAVTEAIRSALPAKRRKDAVLCIEYLITCSPDSFQGDEGYTSYLHDALKWLEAKHGAQNIIAHSIHRDEKTPHLVAYVVPLDSTGKLNAKQFLGGKQTLSAMQTDFAKKVGEKHGLERGIERSTATHTTIREWYGALNQSEKPIEIPASALVPREKPQHPEVKEAPEQIARRLSKAIQRINRPTVERANLADLERRKAQEIRGLVTQVQRELKTAQERAKAAEERAADLRTMYEALAPRQQLAVVQVARRNIAKRQRAERLLSDYFKDAAENVKRYAKRAGAALVDAAGRWWDVAWRKIERDFIEDETPQTGEQAAVRVVLEHSPGRAGMSPQAAQRWLDKAARRDDRSELSQGDNLHLKINESASREKPC